MQKSHSSPSLSTMGTNSLSTNGNTMVPRTPPNSRRTSNQYQRRTVSTHAGILHVPLTPIEMIGFHSLLQVPHSQAAECAVTYNTVDFPEHLITPSNIDAAKDLATCLAMPTEAPTAPETPLFRPTINWLEAATQNTKLMERYNTLRMRVRKAMQQK